MSDALKDAPAGDAEVEALRQRIAKLMQCVEESAIAEGQWHHRAQSAETYLRQIEEARDAAGYVGAVHDCIAGLAAKLDATTSENAKLRARVEELERDRARLDFLDACNAALNGRYGTNYGWSLVLTHNVTRLMLGRNMEVDLHDSEGGNTKLPSCRNAIDREMTRINVERRARSNLGGGNGE